MIDLLERARALAAEGKEIAATMDDLREWNSMQEVYDNFGALHKFVKDVVLLVEQAAGEIATTVQSDDKLNVAVTLIDSAIKLPFFLEWADGPVIKLLIKQAVAYLNDHNLWPDGLGK